MNVLLRCSVIVAACDQAGKSIEQARFVERKRRMDLGLIGRVGEWLAGYSVPYDPMDRVLNLKAIAKHKMGDGVLIVHDPHLSDIATYLPPYVSERV